MSQQSNGSWPAAAAVVGAAMVLIGCNTEERRRCEALADDTKVFLESSKQLLADVGERGLLAGFDPAFQVKTKALETKNDSIADRWEKASDSCKQRVIEEIGPTLEKLSLSSDWTPDATVKTRDQRRAEEAQKAREEAERAEREAKMAADRELMAKALKVTLDEIRREQRGRYSTRTDFMLPVTFTNRSDEVIVGASGRLSCYDNLENLEGRFITSQNELNLPPGQARTVVLVSDDIRHRWLEHARCTKQVWEPEAVRFTKRGLVRVPLGSTF